MSQPALLHGGDHVWTSLQRLRDAEYGGRQVAFGNIRQSRQKPAREPYSNIDSILAWRWRRPGCAPNTSDRNASEARVAVEEY